MVALLGCCSTISRGSTLCCGLQTAPGSPVGGLYPWPEWRVVLTVLGYHTVSHMLKHFITTYHKYSDISHTNQNRNTEHSLHHSPIRSPAQQQLFSVCFPLANVNSRSTNPPIVNFLPTPIAKKKPSILFGPFWILTKKNEQLDISELLKIFCKPQQLSHVLVIISNNVISSSSGP